LPKDDAGLATVMGHEVSHALLIMERNVWVLLNFKV
jgi:hypothetical protein